MEKLSEVLNIFGILHSQGRIAYSKHGDRHERTANGDDECRSPNRKAMFFFCATLPLTLKFPKHYSFSAKLKNRQMRNFIESKLL